MSEENPVTDPALVQNLPVKRKRGRPRKDENLRRVEKSPVVTPKPDTAKKNPPKNISSTSNGDYAMVGQAVSGVLDGSFEAGYLITVKVGDTNTFLRGVVFEPGFVVPISEANDVASNVKMIKRNEIPVDLSGHLHQQYNQKTEQTVKVPEPLPSKAVTFIDQVSKVAELSSSPVHSSPTLSSKGAPFDMNQIPQPSPQALRQTEIRTVRSPHILPGEQANEVNQVIQLSFHSLDAFPKDKMDIPLKGGHDNLNQVELLQGSRISCLKGAANGDETKDLKLELKSGTSIEAFSDNGTIATESEAPDQVAGIEHEPIQKTDGALNGQPVDLNGTNVDAGSHSVVAEIKVKGVEDKQSSVATGSQHVTTQLIAELSKMWEENHVVSDLDIPRKDETSPSNEVVNAADIHALSKPKKDQSTNFEDDDKSTSELLP